MIGTSRLKSVEINKGEIMSIIFLCVICVFTALLMLSNSAFVRITVSVFAIILSTWLTGYLMDARVRKEINGNLNVYLGRPYVELCEYLEVLSLDDPLELQRVVSELKEESWLIYRAWLPPKGNEYFHFIQEIVGNGKGACVDI